MIAEQEVNSRAVTIHRCIDNRDTSLPTIRYCRTSRYRDIKNILKNVWKKKVSEFLIQALAATFL